MKASVHNYQTATNKPTKVSARNPRQIELRRGLIISLTLAIGILVVEITARELFVSGFVVIALLVSAAAFGIAGNLACNRS